MIEGLTAILARINAQGAAGLVAGAILLSTTLWQGCEHRAAEGLAEANARLYMECSVNRAEWMINAEKWRSSAKECEAAARELRMVNAREIGRITAELHAADRARQISEMENTELRNRVERGDITIYELLAAVQSIQ